jgi:hypothetical protein
MVTTISNKIKRFITVFNKVFTFNLTMNSFYESKSFADWKKRVAAANSPDNEIVRYIRPNSSVHEVSEARNPAELDLGLPIIDSSGIPPVMSPSEYYSSLRVRTVPRMQTLHKRYSWNCTVGPDCICKHPLHQRAAAYYHLLTYLFTMHYISMEWSIPSEKKKARVTPPVFQLYADPKLFHAPARMYLNRLFMAPTFSRFNFDISREGKMIDTIRFLNGSVSRLHCTDCGRTIEADFAAERLVLTTLLTIHRTRRDQRNAKLWMEYMDHNTDHCYPTKEIPYPILCVPIQTCWELPTVTGTSLESVLSYLTPTIFTRTAKVVERLDRSTEFVEEKVENLRALPKRLTSFTNYLTDSLNNAHLLASANSYDSAIAMVGDLILWCKATYNTMYICAQTPNGLYNCLYMFLSPLIKPVNLTFVLTSHSLEFIHQLFSPRQRLHVGPHQPIQGPCEDLLDLSEEELLNPERVVNFTSKYKPTTDLPDEPTPEKIYLEGETITERLTFGITRFPNVIATLLSALFVYLFFEKANDKDAKQRSLTTRITDSLRATNNIASLGRNASGFQQLVTTMVGSVKEIISIADTWDDTKLDQEKLKSFILDCKNLSAPELQYTVSSDREMYHRIGVMIDQEREYMKFFMENPELCRNRIYTMFAAAQKELRTLAERRALCRPSFKHPGAKLEPFIICLSGKTKLGKSVLMNHIATKIGKMMNWARAGLIYARNPNDKYWSRYSGEPIVTVDDWAQANGTEQAENEIMEMFAIKTSAPYQLQMAAVSEKGTCFSSEVVIQSTNIPFPVVNSVRDKTALFRRRDMLWEVELTDPNLYAQANKNLGKTNTVNFDHLRFRARDPVDDTKKSSTLLTYDEFIESILTTAADYFVRANTILHCSNLNYETVGTFDDLSTPEGRKKFSERVENHLHPPPAVHTPITFDDLTIPPLDPANQTLPKVLGTSDEQDSDERLYQWFSRCVMLIDRDGNDCRVLLPSDFDANIHYSDDYLVDEYNRLIPRHERRRMFKAHYQALFDTAVEFDDVFEVAFKKPNSRYATFRNYFLWLAPYLTSLLVMKMLWKSLDLEKVKSVAVTCFEDVIKFKSARERMQEKWNHQEACREPNCDLCDYLKTFDGFLASHDLGYNTYIKFKTEHGHKPIEDQIEAVNKILFACKCDGTCQNCLILMSFKDVNLTGTSYHAGADKKTRTVTNVRRTVKPTSSEQHRMQIIKSCKGNFGKMTYKFEDKVRTNVIVALKLRYILINKHFFDKMPVGQNVTLEFMDNAAPFSQEIRKDNIFPFPGQDAVLLRLDANHREFKNITQHFIEDNQLSFDYTQAILVGSDFTNSFPQFFTAERDLEKIYTRQGKFEYNANPFANESIVHIVNGYKYRMPTALGTSGSLAFSFDKQRFVGYQSAADFDNKIGFIGLMTREMIAQAIEGLEKTKLMKDVDLDILAPVISVTCKDTQCDLPIGLDYYGVIDPCDQRRMPDKTRIRASCIQHYFEPKTAPAVLSQSEFRKICPDAPASFAATGVTKYACTESPMFPLPETIRALDIIFERIGTKPRGDVPCRVFTDYEVLNGLKDNENFGPMNFDSSPGFPYVKSKPPGAKGKGYLFNWILEGDRKIAELAEGKFKTEMLDYEAKAKKCILKSSVFIDCPKDERRPIEKLFKTRMFTIGPAHHLYLHRKYFGAIRTHVITNRLTLAPKIGINPFSPEWSTFYHSLIVKGMDSKNFLDRDVSAFDGWRHPSYTQYYTQKINEWYQKYDPNWTEEDDNVRTVLAYDAQYRHVINRNYLYRATRGLISGKDMTDIDNSIQSEFYSLIFWICNKPKGLLDTDFYQYVSIATYGDDVVECVDSRCLSWFNLKEHQKWFARFGIKITDAQKKSEIEASKDIEDIQFLKRKFDTSQGQFRVLAPLSKVTIEEMPLWIHENKFISSEELTRQNVDSALREAVYHGKTYFEEVKLKWNTALEKEGIEKIILRYDELMDQWNEQFE